MTQNFEFINKPRQSGKSRYIDSKIQENLRDNKKVLLVDPYTRRPELWHKDVNFILLNSINMFDICVEKYDYIYIDEYYGMLDDAIDILKILPSTHITCIGTPNGTLSKYSLEFLKKYYPECLFRI